MPTVHPFKRNNAKPTHEHAEIDGGFTISDATWVLQRMQFKKDELLPVFIDSDFRDYLVHTALARR
jgi:hypothetical protein